MHHSLLNQQSSQLDQLSDGLIDQQIDAITLVGNLKTQLDTETQLLREAENELKQPKSLQLSQVESNEDASVDSSESKFYFLDDFFYWLGCQFVTCDVKQAKKDKPQNLQPEVKAEAPK
jgi:hypothetical protein